ncbi:uncharacterized protein LOC128196668 [Vigna angularis]|uniref:uncharacterized protein LOC128196668 n=1 Tax=Phaseolus angularis TaxID=3914 RepID=UPI0022B55DD9|nr:uncharacterized protein LOC128196668 [Vigna angularis]
MEVGGVAGDEGGRAMVAERRGKPPLPCRRRKPQRRSVIGQPPSFSRIRHHAAPPSPDHAAVKLPPPRDQTRVLRLRQSRFCHGCRFAGHHSATIFIMQSSSEITTINHLLPRPITTATAQPPRPSPSNQRAPPPFAKGSPLLKPPSPSRAADRNLQRTSPSSDHASRRHHHRASAKSCLNHLHSENSHSKKPRKPNRAINKR